MLEILDALRSFTRPMAFNESAYSEWLLYTAKHPLDYSSRPFATVRSSSGRPYSTKTLMPWRSNATGLSSKNRSISVIKGSGHS
jgi:hypothetical protein